MKVKILILLLLNSCLLFSQQEKNQLSTFNIAISAIDLSENATTLSTKNDEIVLLLYKNDSLQSPPIFDNYFILDSAKRMESFQFTSNSAKKGKYTLFFLEMDTQKTIEQIEPTIRIYLDTIKNLYNNDKSKLYKYLGDDDIIGIQEFEFDSSKNADKKEFKFEGINYLDTYSYLVYLK